MFLTVVLLMSFVLGTLVSTFATSVQNQALSIVSRVGISGGEGVAVRGKQANKEV